jgi:hypothetical protein
MFHEHSGRLRWHRSRLEAATFHMCWPRTRVYLYSPDYGMWKVDTATGGRSLSQHRRTYCTHGHVWTNNEFQSLSSLAALQFAAFQKESGFWDQGWWCREPFAPSRKSKRASETCRSYHRRALSGMRAVDSLLQEHGESDDLVACSGPAGCLAPSHKLNTQQVYPSQHCQ